MNDIDLTQLKSAISKLPELRNETGSLEDWVKLIKPERLESLISEKLLWSHVYELTFPELIALIIAAFNAVDLKTKAEKTDNPAQYFMDNFRPDFKLEDYEGGSIGTFTKQDLMGLVFALQRNFISIFIYQKTIHQLISEVNEGNLGSLFDAVRVDRSCLSTPSIAAKITEAELKGNKHFFLRLINALKGPSKKHWKAYQDLRFAFYLLKDLGLKNMTEEQVYDLLVRQLKVYPDGYNAKKNLAKQYRESMKIKHLK